MPGSGRSTPPSCLAALYIQPYAEFDADDQRRRCRTPIHHALAYRRHPHPRPEAELAHPEVHEVGHQHGAEQAVDQPARGSAARRMRGASEVPDTASGMPWSGPARRALPIARDALGFRDWAAAWDGVTTKGGARRPQNAGIVAIAGRRASSSWSSSMSQYR